ncbi:hypothetical protein ACHAQJ_002388 [Trichoderma viride]
MPSLSNLKALPIDLEKDWDALFGSFWESWSNPRQAAMVATFPHIGQGGPEEAASFATKKAQYLAAAKTSPGQMWFKVVDMEKPSFPIIGGLCVTHWKDEQNPKHMPDDAHNGFEPGSQIQMVSQQFYGQLHEWHHQLMQPREHIYAQAMWMLPGYRSLRAAPLMTNVIAKLCDDNDVEAYAECVQLSKGLAERIGFEVISTVNFKLNIENPTKESQGLIDEFLSEPLYLMWRPRKSDKNKDNFRPSFTVLRESKL